MRLTLVSIHPCRSPQSIPLAAAYLAATLKESPDLSGRVLTTILDLYVDQPAAECAAAIAATKPELVGFSVYVWNRDRCREVAGILKGELDGVTLFCGGPEATADPGGVLSTGGWDFIIAGEGELPLLGAMKSILGGGWYGDSPGVATLKENGIALTHSAPVTELEQLPSPYLSAIIDPAGYPGVLWQLARGCGFACEFCFDGGGHGGVRRFPMERIEEELALFVAKGVSQVFVLDSTFNQDRRRAKEILRLIARLAPHIHFHFEVRSEFIDREQAGLFAAITCSLQIGLQSADPGVLAGVGRTFRKGEFASRIALLNEAGAIFGFDLIYGLPGDDLEGFRASLDFALSLYPNHLDIFPLAILPGTRLAARSEELGLERLTAPPYTLISTPDFPKGEMARAKCLADACDIFYSRGKAVSWFGAVVAETGLSPSAFLLAFADYLERSGRAKGGEGSLGDDEILALQKGFLTEAYGNKKLKRLLSLAIDLAEYNYHYAAALMAIPPPPMGDDELARLDIPSTPLSLAGSARLASFSYDILEILEYGVPELGHFVRNFPPGESVAVIYPRAGEVFTESLIKPYFRLLQKLDGITTAGKLAASLRIPKGEAISFLEFALAEGIAVPAVSSCR